MAARQARYTFFALTAQTVGATAVATAHTRDDQAETVLLKLCRGAGSAGLDGIARSTVIEGLRVVRPLLDVSRKDVEHFLRERGIAWREDGTNADTTIKRNCLRHDVLPLLEQQFNPRVKEALARTATILADENQLLETLALAALDDAVADPALLRVAPLWAMPPALRRRVVQQWLIRTEGMRAADMRFELVERVVALATATCGAGAVSLGTNHEVRREYAHLRLVGTAAEDIVIPETRLAVPGETALAAAGLRVTTEPRTGFERIATGPVGRLPAEACIRWDAVVPPVLQVRSWRPGDRLEPLGMEGSCKLQDLFTDAKVPRHARAQIPVFLCNDDVVWLPGCRIARNWAVLDARQCSLQLRVTVR